MTVEHPTLASNLPPPVSLLIYRRTSNSKSAHSRNTENSATVTVVSTHCDTSTVLNPRQDPRDGGPLICGWLGALGKEQESGCWADFPQHGKPTVAAMFF